MRSNIISDEEAGDLLSKLLHERIPVVAFAVSPTGAKTRIDGFVDSITADNGLVVSVARPPSSGAGYIGVLLNCPHTFAFGDDRELRVLPEEERERLTGKCGNATLTCKFSGTDEWFALFFNL